MIRLRRTITLLLLFTLAAGCSGNSSPTMPETMPDDFNFSVRFGITAKNEINTFHNQVTKDLIMNGTAAADLTLTDEEMKSIYERMRKINVLRDLELEPKEKTCAKVPYSEAHWKIQLNGETREFHWSELMCPVTDDAEQLEELRKFVFDIVKSKKEYEELPDAAGGYD